MRMSLIFDESYGILKDILTMCSIMYQRGIVDANNFCDPLAMRNLAERSNEDHFTTLKLIMEYQIHTLDQRQYLNMVRAYASEARLFHYINFTNRKGKMIPASCTLLDYCYRIGVGRTTVFDRSRIDTMLKTVKPGSTIYFTPKGKIRELDWYYEIRSYITAIEMEREANGLPTDGIVKLDKFLASTMKQRNELMITEEIENARRSFILSGGSL